MTKICLIDGSGYIFRAFYALPPMSAPDGTPINAVYGIMMMFMRLLNKIKCDGYVVVFDAKRENFRNKIFPQYKANRAAVPELLIPQFDIIHQAVEAMNLPWIMQEGYEADDLIASYSQAALQKNWDVVIVSADKDLMQLIQPHVEFYDGMKDKFFTPSDVQEKFGVLPDKVVDVQALAGDTTDNIPGVPGIGLKTAAELINQFGSLQNVLDNAEQISQNRRRQLLMQYKDSALISLQLVILEKHAPLACKLEDFKVQPPSMQSVLQFADKYGFKSVRPKLIQWVEERCAEYSDSTFGEQKIKPQVVKQYKKIETPADLAQCQNDIVNAQRVAFEVLTDGQKICALSLSACPNSAYFLPIRSSLPSYDLFADTSSQSLAECLIKQFLLNIFNDKNITKIAADLKTQWHMLYAYLQTDVDLFAYQDISVMSYVLDSSEHGHDIYTLSQIYLAEDLEKPTAQKDKPIDFCQERFGKYVFEISDFAMQIYNKMSERIIKEKKNYVYETIERRLVQVLYAMEKNGIMIDESALLQLDKELSAQLATTQQQIYELAGEEFNIASPKQIGEILFAKNGLKGKKTSSGSFNTSAQVLEKLALSNPLAAKILEWRSYAKLKSTYTTSLLQARDKQGLVHTTFLQTVVNTGRLSSINPNLQNIPNHGDMGRKIRACFTARKGYKIIDADYSQMELRLLAAVADVKALKEAFAEGIDIHTATAAKVFNLEYANVDKETRSRAKAINFGIVYGISQYGLAKQIGSTNDEAKQYIDTYFKIMPEIKNYMEKTKEFAHANGYVLTPFGRKCSIFGINDTNKSLVAMAERAAINAPIQGGAADLVKIAMQRVYFALKQKYPEAKMLLQVHDELVVEAKEEQAQEIAVLMKNIMEDVADLSVKMVAEPQIGNNWAAAH